jgi:hypothetical protein
MNKEFERLRAEIDKLLEQPEQLDAEQDAALGSRRGDELPDELKRRQQRLAKIQEAKARLETEARTKAEAEQRRRDEERAEREAEGRRRGKEPAPIDPTPEDKAQTNFTDPEAKIMKQSNKGFDYSYNAQAVVDGAEQIIVAAEVTNAANDKQQAVPMAQAALNNLDGAGIERPMGADGHPAPIPNTADTGYFSEKAVETLETMGIDPHIATGRQKHHEAPVEPEPAALSAEASAEEKMRYKLKTAAGKALYAARKHIVEPVFGMTKSARGLRRFLLRGLEKVSAEWQLICLTPIPFVLAQVIASCNLGVCVEPRFQGGYDDDAARKLPEPDTGCARRCGSAGGLEQGYLAGGYGTSSVGHGPGRATCLPVVAPCHALGGVGHGRAH